MHLVIAFIEAVTTTVCIITVAESLNIMVKITFSCLKILGTLFLRELHSWQHVHRDVNNNRMYVIDRHVSVQDNI